MDEQIAIAGGEEEAGAELERIVSEAVLAMASGPGARACLGVLAAEEMEQVCGFQSGGLVGGALGIDQQGEGNAGFLAKQAGIIRVTESDGSEGGSGLLEFVFVLAQLRDMLAAEDSAVVAQEDHDRRSFLPQ